jgi:hypothetical protein
VALLSCFTIGGPATITTGTVIATLRLRVAAPGDGTIEIAEAVFGGSDGTEIGSCNPAGDVPVACKGLTVQSIARG